GATGRSVGICQRRAAVCVCTAVPPGLPLSCIGERTSVQQLSGGSPRRPGDPRPPAAVPAQTTAGAPVPPVYRYGLPAAGASGAGLLLAGDRPPLCPRTAAVSGSALAAGSGVHHHGAGAGG